MKNLLPLLLSVLLITSCSKKSDPEPSVIIDSPTLGLKYDQQHQFALKKGSEDIFASTFAWKSSNEKVGKIDANGRFTARKIGETTITGTSNGKNVESKVTISPLKTFVTEPILEFGSTIANVKSKEKRKLVQETDDLLVYEGENSKVKLISYYKQNGKITTALLIFENITTTVMDVTTYFKERFPQPWFSWWQCCPLER
ncbi:Ig-like domain-containing protein [Dyadobacter sp. LHD-138]|uniref:Ig-like domain-containing protein n=1 Tax=Dyadobacter sp. LHD-138 TaxID=3071413 RepID=UPI0027DFEFCB|nr:Ig-like domain-containing protein [Dyadobacter sp. LHD-138]MDQ6477845.1 Ig-like domain-containing protein [Dyadobacter sp. LHD-138]